VRKQLVRRGPTNAVEFDWWKIDYDSRVDGWTVEDNLQKVITPPPTAPSSFSNRYKRPDRSRKFPARIIYGARKMSLQNASVGVGTYRED
jgi:hypothetical protein